MFAEPTVPKIKKVVGLLHDRQVPGRDGRYQTTQMPVRLLTYDNLTLVDPLCYRLRIPRRVLGLSIRRTGTLVLRPFRMICS